MKAAIYSRVSTTDQVDTGTSLGVQAERCASYVDSRGWELVGTYSDEGVSGTKDSRPQLDRLMAACRAGQVDVVVVHKLDRFTRSVRQLANAVFDLEAMKVTFVSVTEGIDGTTTTGRLLRHTLSSIAEFERDSILERTRSGARKTAANGRWPGGPAPYGHAVQDGRLVVNEAEADVLRLATGLVIDQGVSAYEVSKRLNALGRLPRKASRWVDETVRHVLSSETLRGSWTYSKTGKGGEPITVPIPPVLAAERFDALQAALNARSTNPTRKYNLYPLSLRITGTCGHPFSGVNRKDRSTRFYRCRNGRTDSAPRCTDRMINANDLEEVVWSEVVGLLADPARLMAMAATVLELRDAEVGVEQEQVTEVEKRIAAIEDAMGERVAQALKAGVPAKGIKAATATLEAELSALHRHKAQLQAWADHNAATSDRKRQLLQLAKKARTRLARMNPEERTALLRLLDVRVRVVSPGSRREPAQVVVTGAVTDDLFAQVGAGDGRLAPLAGQRTPPFGHPRPLQVLVDRDLLGYDLLWAAAGTPDSVFPIAPEQLVAVSGGRVADFKEEG